MFARLERATQGMSHQGITFALDPARSADEVLGWLAARFPARERAPATVRLTYLDTFDGRLSRAGESLSAQRDDGRTRLELGEGPRALELAVPGDEPAFARDLPGGRMRERLAHAAQMRRLLPLVEVERRERGLDLLDREEKTVARVRLDRARARAPGNGHEWHPLPVRLRIEPVRGYERAFESLKESVAEAGLTAVVELPVELAARAVGREPGEDPSKPRFELEPGMRADVGMKRVHRALLGVMLANQPGVRADLDSEFLHDFRVAVRRARSLLGQVRRVLPDGAVAAAREELAWVGELTGPTRDLDVFLSGLEERGARLPRADLEALRSVLERRKLEEHARLAAGLDSPRFVALIESWRAFLDDEAPPAGEAPALAGEPLRQVLSKRVWRLYRRVAAQRESLGADSRPEELHRLRIECKKLRYLIDCARSLHEKEPVERELASLRALQDVLGEHNDAHVQIEKLRRFGQGLFDEGRATPSLLMTLGAMTERLRERADLLRLEFETRSEGLCGQASRKRWRALFAAS